MASVFVFLYLACVLMAGIGTYPVVADNFRQSDNAATLRLVRNLNASIPNAAREAVTRADDLAAQDRAQEAIESLRRAIALAPNYVNAHAKYIEIKGNFMGRYDEARAEYEALKAKEPDNPVYPMALGVARYNTFPEYQNRLFEKVLEIAPADWGWCHYAKAYLAADKEPETAVKELLAYVAEDGSAKSPYYTLSYIQENLLGRLDDAMETAEKMAARPEFHAEGLTMLWRLHLGKAGGTPEAKAKLKSDLDALATSSSDIKLLDAAHNAYSNLLQDKESAVAIEKKVRQLDPSWYPERGHTLYFSMANMSGASRLLVASNRQCAIIFRMDEVDDPSDPKARIIHLESLLKHNPNTDLKRYIYEQIFVAAEKAKDTRALVKYGDLLFSIDPTDAGVPARIAIALSKKQVNARAALHYATLADKATAVYHPLPRPANNGRTDEEWNTTAFPEKQQRRYYANLRALTLEALGLALCQSLRCAEAEGKLRQALELHRSEHVLSTLANTLERLGRKPEAQQFAEAAKAEYVGSLKRRFTNDAAKDFELTTFDGRRVKLSDLKGKVVVLDFWATWCGPCREGTPFIVNLYKRYKDRGLEILYVSVDSKSDQYKVAPFAREHGIIIRYFWTMASKNCTACRAFLPPSS